jgi:hypothetical protein
MQLALEPDHDFSQSRADRDAAVEQFVAAQGIETSEEFARVKVEDFIPFLELIEFLQHGDRDDDIVLLKPMNAGAVMKDDVRIEDEQLPLPLRIPLRCSDGGLPSLVVLSLRGGQWSEAPRVFRADGTHDG